MPSHNHLARAATPGTASGFRDGFVGLTNSYSQDPNFTTANSGGGKPHNNMPPYIVQNFIIKAYNNARTLSIVENSLDSDSTKNAVSVHIVNKKIAELQAQITALQTQIDTKSLNINGAQTIWYEDETNT